MQLPNIKPEIRRSINSHRADTMESAMSNIETACSGTGKPNTRYPQLNADVRSIALLTALAAVAFRRLPETNTSAPQRLKPGAILNSYATVLADRVALTYAVTTGLVFAAMSAYFAASPALFIGHLGVGAAEYGLYPPIAVTGFIFGGIVTRRLVGKVPPQRIAGIGLGLTRSIHAVSGSGNSDGGQAFKIFPTVPDRQTPTTHFSGNTNHGLTSMPGNINRCRELQNWGVVLPSFICAGSEQDASINSSRLPAMSANSFRQ
jgi:hypothetical protein